MIVDIIMPSKTNAALAPIARSCIESLHASEPRDKFAWNVVVVETEKEETPENIGQDSTIFYPHKEFNYNGALNLGIKETHSDWVVLTNNDVIFHQGWFREILRINTENPSLMSFCHWCNYDAWHPTRYPNIGNVEFIENDWIGYGMASWTITVKRTLLEAIGTLSERVAFWYSDNVYADALRSKGFKHVLSTKSYVDHLSSKTIRTLSYNSSIDKAAYYGNAL